MGCLSPRPRPRPGAHASRILWTVALVSSITGAWLLIGGSWRRFQDNPTVVSLEKDFRLWNTSFPSATMCFDRRLDDNKAQEVIAE